MSDPDQSAELRRIARALEELTFEVRHQGRLLAELLRAGPPREVDWDLIEHETDRFEPPHREQPSTSARSTLGFRPQPGSGDSGYFSGSERLAAQPSANPLPGPRAPPVSAPPESRSARTPPSATISEAERTSIARDMGGFFSRALAGEHRGLSGRARNPLASKVYVVVRGASGEVYNPPLLLNSFGEARRYCESAGALQDSVFCGFPTLWEAKVACLAAGLAEPEPPRRSPSAQ